MGYVVCRRADVYAEATERESRGLAPLCLLGALKHAPPPSEENASIDTHMLLVNDKRLIKNRVL